MIASNSDQPLSSLQATGNLPGRQRVASAMRWILMVATCFAVMALAVLLWYIVSRGWSWLSWG